jgi:hypothetical protein
MNCNQPRPAPHLWSSDDAKFLVLPWGSDKWLASDVTCLSEKSTNAASAKGLDGKALKKAG